MKFDIEVNNKKITVYRGETILSALERNGINIPTLCHLKKLSPTGSCRMCVVEVEGKEGLVTSCSYPVEEWMKIYTHSPRVINARKSIIEMLLASHPDDCLYCIRNTDCELQRYAAELNVKERRFPNSYKRKKIDNSGAGIVYDPSKCILCGRCIRVCDEVQNINTFDVIKRGSLSIVNTCFSKSIANSNCIYCGQCVLVCPTAALTEKSHINNVIKNFNDKSKINIAICSPTVLVSIAEEFGIKPSKNYNGQIVGALKKLGFAYVFDLSSVIDLHAYETAYYIAQRIKSGIKEPLFSSCCPAWVKYAEQSDFQLKQLSPIKSPQQMMGTLIKTYFADKNKIDPEQIFSVSIMPCLAKKYEAQRDEHNYNNPFVDSVLSTRELIKLIKMNSIDFFKVIPEAFDQPFSLKSSASTLYSITGGVAEAILRNFLYILSNKEPSEIKFSKLRGFKGIKDINIKIENFNIDFAVINGQGNVKDFLNEMQKNNKVYDFVEVMSCEGGCINGGGQSLKSSDDKIKSRAKIVYDNDERDIINASYKNSFIIDLYDNYLIKPNSEKCIDLFFTTYKPKTVLN